MNWGRKLMAVFFAFALLMIGLVYMCTQQHFDLVTKDYYSEELRYQDKIDAMNNAAQLSDIAVRQNAENVVIELPKEMHGNPIIAQAWFYCATDAAKDGKIELVSDEEGKNFISKSKLVKTNYLLKLNWKRGNETYYIEKEISVQ